MESGGRSDGLNPWTVVMFRTLKTSEPQSASQQAAYAKWLDQRSDRQGARTDRLHGAQGVIPTPLWVVLFLSALVIFGFMLLFADSGERAFVQATMMGCVAVVITSTLLLLWFLDNPFHAGVGGLKPTAMERTLEIVDQGQVVSAEIKLPCDSDGTPR
jgi:hypothetical protein